MKKILEIINKNYSMLLMLLLYALGLANIGYNVIKNWNIKENSYSVKFSDHKSEDTVTGLKIAMRYDPAHPELPKLVRERRRRMVKCPLPYWISTAPIRVMPFSSNPSI